MSDVDPRWLPTLAEVLGVDEADIMETTGTHVRTSDGEWHKIAGATFRGHVLRPWKRVDEEPDAELTA